MLVTDKDGFAVFQESDGEICRKDFRWTNPNIGIDKIIAITANPFLSLAKEDHETAERIISNYLSS